VHDNMRFTFNTVLLVAAVTAATMLAANLAASQFPMNSSGSVVTKSAPQFGSQSGSKTTVFMPLLRYF
jgi:hypothetical protein